MTKLACYIYQWYVVVLLVLGYAILSNGAEFQGIKVIINGGTLNPYLASLQVGDTVVSPLVTGVGFDDKENTTVCV
jgi:hypothetical protein